MILRSTTQLEEILSRNPGKKRSWLQRYQRLICVLIGLLTLSLVLYLEAGSQHLAHRVGGCKSQVVGIVAPIAKTIILNIQTL